MLVCQAKELVWVAWHETVQSPAPVLSLHWQRNAQGGGRECSRDGCPSFSSGSLSVTTSGVWTKYKTNSKVPLAFSGTGVILLKSFPLLSYFVVFITLWSGTGGTCLTWLWAVSVQRGTARGSHLCSNGIVWAWILCPVLDLYFGMRRSMSWNCLLLCIRQLAETGWDVGWISPREDSFVA